MKEYTPKELQLINSDLYDGVKLAFKKAVPTFIENVTKVLSASPDGVLEHGSFCRLTDDDDNIVYLQLVGVFMNVNGDIAFGLSQIFIYNTEFEYNNARVDVVHATKEKFGDMLNGADTTTHFDGGLLIFGDE